MGKLFGAILICGALGAAALCVPFEGRTGWQRARAGSHELPHAAARAVAHGVRAGWDWVASVASSSHGAPASALPTHNGPAHSPARRAARRPLAAGEAPVPAELAQPAVQARDGIVKAPPTEQHAPGDRAALDKLVQSR